MDDRRVFGLPEPKALQRFLNLTLWTQINCVPCPGLCDEAFPRPARALETAGSSVSRTARNPPWNACGSRNWFSLR